MTAFSSRSGHIDATNRGSARGLTAWRQKTERAKPSSASPARTQRLHSECLLREPVLSTAGSVQEWEIVAHRTHRAGRNPAPGSAGRFRDADQEQRVRTRRRNRPEVAGKTGGAGRAEPHRNGIVHPLRAHPVGVLLTRVAHQRTRDLGYRSRRTTELRAVDDQPADAEESGPGPEVDRGAAASHGPC